MEWIVVILVGILAGWIAEKIMRRNHGLLTNLVVGVIGALIGNFIFGMLGLGVSGFLGSLIAAVVGACLLLFVLGLVKRRT